ncbi:6263_t:CDS:2 [Acaulospora morrowiae]|uniref:Eukaryotic translation initiation factor 3 30 kDa subunit n=1 Tax=Acaulospora morrowiae TaxID=94023 RepID=A0A9N8W0L6_9GLOM|nr:6263_t:CDS:2 [Acaulospora morrowiae]
MDEEWEGNSGDVVPNISIASKKNWDGEDIEEEDIKDSWDLESSSDEEDAPKTGAAPKKSIAQKIAERQAAERKNHNHDKDESDALGKKIDNTVEMTKGLSIDEKEHSALDMINPKTRDEFDEFSSLLIKRIKRHENQAPYSNFINVFVRDLCSSLKDAEIRKVANTLTTLANEKKAQKDALKTKKKKPKPSVVVDAQETKSFDDYEDDFEYFI